MKVNPVYKCKRCGEVITKNDVEVDSDDFDGINLIDLHTCDIDVGKNDLAIAMFGFTDLVGFNEVEK